MSETDTTTATATEAVDTSNIRPELAVSAAFGDIVNILMRTEPYRSLSLQDLGWLVLPAIKARQFAIAHARPKSKDDSKPAARMPVAVVLWAAVSDEVDARLRAHAEADPFKLAPDEWQSGKHNWVIAAAGVAEPLRTVLKQTHEQVFKGSPASIRVLVNGKPSIQTLGGA